MHCLSDKHRHVLWLSLCLELQLSRVLILAQTVRDCNYAKEIINLINSVCKQQYKETVSLLPPFISLSVSPTVHSLSLYLLLLSLYPSPNLTQGSFSLGDERLNLRKASEVERRKHPHYLNS